MSTIAAAAMLMFIVVVAVQFSRQSAGLARSGRDWGRAERTWIVNYIWMKLPSPGRWKIESEPIGT